VKYIVAVPLAGLASYYPSIVGVLLTAVSSYSQCVVVIEYDKCVVEGACGVLFGASLSGSFVFLFPAFIVLVGV
jgi:hypothetical protein